MKIKPEDFIVLRKMIDKVLNENPGMKGEYIKRGLSATRYNFDVLHASVGGLDFVYNTLYKYMDDNHLETALKRITGVKSL